MATKTIAALNEEATAKREQAAKLIEKAEALEAQAKAQGEVFDHKAGDPVRVTRRDGSVEDGTFQAAKDTDRGILVAVLVGDGFDAETLKLPVSKVEFVGTVTEAE